MNPLLIEGVRLMAPALVTAAKSIPASQLARFGLLRGPLVGLGPVALGVASGAALTALLMPQSRRWVADQVARVLARPEPNAVENGSR